MNRIYGLDAIRIMGEFLVVMFHYGEDFQGSKATYLVAYDLMSLFFILSGTVCTLKFVNNDDPDLFCTRKDHISFWSKKLKYTTPVYFFFCFVNLINFLQAHAQVCPLWKNVCIVLDFFLLSNWFLCPRMIMDVVLSGWFIAILFQLWIMFPFCFRHIWRPFFANSSSFWVWAKISFLFCVIQSLGGIAYVHGVDISFFPLCRLLDFSVGVGVAYTLDKPLSVLYLLSSAACLFSLYLYVHFYLQYQAWACFEISMHHFFDYDNICKLSDFHPFLSVHEFSKNHSVYFSHWKPSLPCYTFLRYFWGKAVFFFAMLIHYVGSRNLLRQEIFRHLNPLSFMLYISHLNIYSMFQSILRLLHLPPLQNLSARMVLAYISSYVLNKIYIFIFKKITRIIEKCTPQPPVIYTITDTEGETN